MLICEYLTEAVMDTHPLHADKQWLDSLTKVTEDIIGDMHIWDMHMHKEKQI